MTDRPIAVISPDQAQRYANLGTLSCKIPSQLTNDACTVLELQLQPGQGSGMHFHKYEDEMLLVQAGSCTVGNAQHSWLLETGSWVVFPKYAEHFFQNTSNTACTLLITALPGGLDRYFADLDAAIQQQDAQAVVAVHVQYGITFVD
jgi:quercetin dioxygenase-like cupin family protein